MNISHEEIWKTIEYYKEFREQDERAADINWIRQHPIYVRIDNILSACSLSWVSFKNIAGYEYSAGAKITIQDTIDDLKLIVSHNEKAINSEWLNENGHSSIVRRVYRFGIKWPVFLLLAGFPPGEDTMADLKEISIETLSDALNIFHAIQQRMGKDEKESSLNRKWMGDNGYGWFIYSLRKIDISWSHFTSTFNRVKDRLPV